MRACPSSALLSCKLPFLLRSKASEDSPDIGGRAQPHRHSRFAAADRSRPGKLTPISRTDRVRIQPRSASGFRGSGGCIDDFASFLIAAVWASLMRLLHLVAVGTF